MSEVAAFLSNQTVVVQAALYIAALVVLVGAGGMALVTLVRALDRLGAMLTSNPEWTTRGETTKEETLLLVSVLIYAQVLISFDGPLREVAGVVGSALFTALTLAPIAGALLFGAASTPRLSSARP